MAHGLNSVLKRNVTSVSGCNSEGKTGIGSRRIFAPHFKLQVLDSYRNDSDCKGNQRATARKYGIHRRQIQKWLQVENTLRNSVHKGNNAKMNNNSECENVKCEIEMALRNSCRQRGDCCSVNMAETRVPALSPHKASPWPDSTAQPPAPLDFTTHARSPIVSPVLADPVTPMDLSFKRPNSLAAGFVCAPVPFPHARTPSPPSHARSHPDVWDLSTKKKYNDEEAPTPSKPIKLFKPYLDDISECSNSSSDDKISNNNYTPPCYTGSLPITITSTACDLPYYYNNNNVYEIKTEYSTYTLLELQPKNYYYNLPSNNPIYQSSEYEVNNIYTSYEDQTGNYLPLKQRQSYSLDFKLSAIDCYYQDSICKGNQRAVATKYNIHRRQVQKWLKQAEELRHKNETLKHNVR